MNAPRSPWIARRYKTLHPPDAPRNRFLAAISTALVVPLVSGASAAAALTASPSCGSTSHHAAAPLPDWSLANEAPSNAQQRRGSRPQCARGLELAPGPEVHVTRYYRRPPVALVWHW